MDSINITNSLVDDSAKIYSRTRIVDSTIGDNCCIGDECDIVHCIMSTHSELGRRNLVRDSEIGKGTYTGTNTIIKNAIIGKYCSISWNVSIGGGNHNYNNVSMYTDYWFRRTFGVDAARQEEKESVLIGNDVWIGAGAIINNGVVLGNGCVVGAGAVVTHDVPKYAIVAGVPAKTIKYRFDDETIELLERLKWWDWSDDTIRENIALLTAIPLKEEIKEMVEKYDT